MTKNPLSIRLAHSGHLYPSLCLSNRVGRGTLIVMNYLIPIRLVIFNDFKESNFLKTINYTKKVVFKMINWKTIYPTERVVFKLCFFKNFNPYYRSSINFIEMKKLLILLKESYLKVKNRKPFNPTNKVVLIFHETKNFNPYYKGSI